MKTISKEQLHIALSLVSGRRSPNQLNNYELECIGYCYMSKFSCGKSALEEILEKAESILFDILSSSSFLNNNN